MFVNSESFQPSADESPEKTPRFDGWIQVKLSGFNVGLMACFTHHAWRVAFNRHGHYEIIVMWGELQALAAGVAKGLTPEAQHARLGEGLRYFAKRQKLNAVDV